GVGHLHARGVWHLLAHFVRHALLHGAGLHRANARRHLLAHFVRNHLGDGVRHLLAVRFLHHAGDRRRHLAGLRLMDHAGLRDGPRAHALGALDEDLAGASTATAADVATRSAGAAAVLTGDDALAAGVAIRAASRPHRAIRNLLLADFRHMTHFR